MKDSKSHLSKESIDRITPAVANFYLSEGNEMLRNTVTVGNHITERAYILLTAMVTVMTGFGWVLSGDRGWLYLACSAIGLIASLTVIAILISKVITIHTICVPGQTPSGFKIDKFMDYYRQTGTDGERMYVDLVVGHLDNVETAIQHNLNDIKQRTLWYGRCLYIILCSSIAIGFLLLLSGLIQA